MAAHDAATRLARVLRTENACLAGHDAAGAAALLEEKQAAIDGLRASMHAVHPEPSVIAELRELATENAERLRLAVEVQSRILELVGAAARRTAIPTRYGARGGLAMGSTPALVARA